MIPNKSCKLGICTIILQIILNKELFGIILITVNYAVHGFFPFLDGADNHAPRPEVIISIHAEIWGFRVGGLQFDT